jgi:hypothetical protein
LHRSMTTMQNIFCLFKEKNSPFREFQSIRLPEEQHNAQFIFQVFDLTA